MDPLEWVRHYTDPEDQEIAGLVAAALALGRAELIREAVQDILGRMGPSPHAFVLAFDPERDLTLFKGFVYRFFRDADIGLLLCRTKKVLLRYGSLGNFFLEGYHPSHEHTGPSLSSFVRRFKELDLRPDSSGQPLYGIRQFLADPVTGAACKRLNLYLRWMVRRDGLDLGLWKIPASKLVIPLDTHLIRLGSRLGLTLRRTPDWRMALDITQSLRQLDPDDPVKYDFALCTLGKLRPCPADPDVLSCESCPVFGCCQSFRIASAG